MRDTARHCASLRCRLVISLHPRRSYTVASSSRTIRARKSFATRPAYRTHPIGWLPETGTIMPASQPRPVLPAVAMSAGSQGTIQSFPQFTRPLPALAITSSLVRDSHLAFTPLGAHLDHLLASQVLLHIALCIVALFTESGIILCALSHCHTASGITPCALHYDCSSV